MRARNTSDSLPKAGKNMCRDGRSEGRRGAGAQSFYRRRSQAGLEPRRRCETHIRTRAKAWPDPGERRPLLEANVVRPGRNGETMALEPSLKRGSRHGAPLSESATRPPSSSITRPAFAVNNHVGQAAWRSDEFNRRTDDRKSWSVLHWRVAREWFVRPTCCSIHGLMT